MQPLEQMAQTLFLAQSPHQEEEEEEIILQQELPAVQAAVVV